MVNRVGRIAMGLRRGWAWVIVIALVAGMLAPLPQAAAQGADDTRPLTGLAIEPLRRR